MQEKGEEENQVSPRTIDLDCGFAKDLILQGMRVSHSIVFVHPHAKMFPSVKFVLKGFENRCS